MQLSEVVVIRITPQLKESLQLEASRLGLRTVDVMRFALAQAVSENNSGEMKKSGIDVKTSVNV